MCIRDSINNGAKEPTVTELEQQARSGQPISLMDLADAVHRKEREKKKSVMEQLKGQPKTEHKKTCLLYTSGAWATWPVLRMQTAMTPSMPSGDMMTCLFCRSIGRW